jgi:hypothetical protein
MIRFMLLVLVSGCLLLTACGGGKKDNPVSLINPDAIYVTSRSVTFVTGIDPASIAQLDPVTFYESVDDSKAEFYLISSQQELVELNQLLSFNEQLAFADLEQSTYLLLRAPACPGWEELASLDVNPEAENGFILKVHHFTLPDAACAAVVEEIYSLFKAQKP